MDKIAKIDAQIAKAKLAYDAIKNQSNTAWEKIQTLKSKRCGLLLEQYKGQDFVPEILLNTHLPHPLWIEQCRQWSVLGLGTSGCNTDTNQMIPRIMLTKEDDAKTEKQYQAVCKLLPHMKADASGKKVIGIFEHTLSAGDIYSLHVYDHHVDMHTHYRGEIKSFDSLLDAMTYVHKNHWYDSSERNKYEEED